MYNNGIYSIVLNNVKNIIRNAGGGAVAETYSRNFGAAEDGVSPDFVGGSRVNTTHNYLVNFSANGTTPVPTLSGQGGFITKPIESVSITVARWKALSRYTGTRDLSIVFENDTQSETVNIVPVEDYNTLPLQIGGTLTNRTDDDFVTYTIYPDLSFLPNNIDIISEIGSQAGQACQIQVGRIDIVFSNDPYVYSRDFGTLDDGASPDFVTGTRVFDAPYHMVNFASNSANVVTRLYGQGGFIVGDISKISVTAGRWKAVESYTGTRTIEIEFIKDSVVFDTIVVVSASDYNDLPLEINTNVAVREEDDFLTYSIFPSLAEIPDNINIISRATAQPGQACQIQIGRIDITFA